MLDIGWPELLLIMAVTIVVVGPRELPRTVRAITGFIRKIRNMAWEFQHSLAEVADSQDVAEIKKELLTSKNDLLDEGKSIGDHSAIGELQEVQKSMEEMREVVSGGIDTMFNPKPYRGNKPSSGQITATTPASPAKKVAAEKAVAKKTATKKTAGKKTVAKNSAKKVAAKSARPKASKS
ncbi:MAG: Sec-independent protein translocase protein TatB [Pseudomonadota bacterium]